MPCINTGLSRPKGLRHKLKLDSRGAQGGATTPSGKPWRSNPVGLDGVTLHWINTANTAMSDAAASQDAARPDSGESSLPGAQQEVTRRAADPSVVRSISSTLSKPIKTKVDFVVVCAALDDTVSHLPLAALGLYRPALETLASADSAPSPEGVSVPSLAARTRDAIKFIDSPDLAWAPQHKLDYMAFRSLSERVHTAEQMEPHVDELLGWLADPNWPPYLGCQKQLARFPELTIGPIRERILKERTDAEWLLHILEFVEEYVPVRTSWKRIEPQLIQLANSEIEDEQGTCIELTEAAQRMLRLLKEAGEADAG